MGLMDIFQAFSFAATARKGACGQRWEGQAQAGSRSVISTCFFWPRQRRRGNCSVWRRPLEMSLHLQKALQVLFIVVVAVVVFVVAVVVFAAAAVVAALVYRSCFSHSAC